MYMQFTTSNSIDNWKKERKHKKQEKNITSWMTNKAIPKEMESEILGHIHKKFEEDENVCVEDLILDILPSKLQGEVKYHICFNLLKQVSFVNSINLLNNCLSPCIVTKFIQKENHNSINKWYIVVNECPKSTY